MAARDALVANDAISEKSAGMFKTDAARERYRPWCDDLIASNQPRPPESLCQQLAAAGRFFIEQAVALRTKSATGTARPFSRRS